jgi:hypothetical protein
LLVVYLSLIKGDNLLLRSDRLFSYYFTFLLFLLLLLLLFRTIFFFCFFFFVLFAFILIHLNLSYRLVVLRKHCCYLEHLASTFTVTGSDDWSVDVEEASLLKEAVSGISQVVADSCHGRYELCARPQVGDIAKVFDSVSLFSERVGVTWALTNNLASMGFSVADLKLYVLALCWRLDQFTLNLKARANCCFSDLSEVGY